MTQGLSCRGWEFQLGRCCAWKHLKTTTFLLTQSPLSLTRAMHTRCNCLPDILIFKAEIWPLWRYRESCSVSVKWKQKTRAPRACTDNIPAFPFFKGIKRMKPGRNNTGRHSGLCALVLTVTYNRIPADWIQWLRDVLKICCRNKCSYKSCLYNFCKFAQRLKFDFLKMQPTWNSAVTHLEMRLQQAFEQHAIKKRGSWCNSL